MPVFVYVIIIILLVWLLVMGSGEQRVGTNRMGTVDDNASSMSSSNNVSNTNSVSIYETKNSQTQNPIISINITSRTPWVDKNVPHLRYSNFASLNSAMHQVPVDSVIVNDTRCNSDVYRQISDSVKFNGVLLQPLNENFTPAQNDILADTLTNSKNTQMVFDVSPIPKISPQLKKIAATIALRPDSLI